MQNQYKIIIFQLQFHSISPRWAACRSAVVDMWPRDTWLPQNHHFRGKIFIIYWRIEESIFIFIHKKDTVPHEEDSSIRERAGVEIAAQVRDSRWDDRRPRLSVCNKIIIIKTEFIVLYTKFINSNTNRYLVRHDFGSVAWGGHQYLLRTTLVYNYKV